MWIVIWQRLAAWMAGGAFVIAGAGMGLGFTRTGVAMLAASSDVDRGFNSSALSIADSLGAASRCPCAASVHRRHAAGRDPFLAVFGVGSSAPSGGRDGVADALPPGHSRRQLRVTTR